MKTWFLFLHIHLFIFLALFEKKWTDLYRGELLSFHCSCDFFKIFTIYMSKEMNRSISRGIPVFASQLCIFFTIPSGPSMMKQPGNTTDLVALQTERGSQLVHYWRTKRCTCENRNRSKSRGFPILASQLFLLTF